MNVYQASLMEDDDDDDDDDDVDEETTGSNNNGNVPVLARLLGLEEERDSLLDFFLELSPPADVLGEFWSWAPQAICCSRDPSTFGGPLDWYLPLMKGIDEAFDLMKRTTSNSKSTVTHKTMFQVGQQRLAAFQKKQQRQQRQQRRQEGKEATTPTGGAVKASLMAPSPMTTSPTTTAAVDAASPTSVLAIINCETPQQQQQLQLQQQSQLQDPTPESMATSPSSSSSYSSQETTPTHSNKKMRPRNGPRNDSNRDLFPKTNHPKASGTPSFLSSSSSSSPTATTTTTTAAARSESNDTQPALGDATKTNGNKRRSASASNYVTPSRSSRRPKRQAVLKTDALTPTSSRRHSHDDDDDDEFYFFANLIQFLQHALGWKYSKAKSDLHAWVYERVDTAGEPNGTYLEDYFYEEQQVVDYCRHHNYKEQYGHYLILAGKPNATDEDGMGGGNAQAIITPPGAKRTRTTIH